MGGGGGHIEGYCDKKLLLRIGSRFFFYPLAPLFYLIFPLVPGPHPWGCVYEAICHSVGESRCEEPPGTGKRLPRRHEGGENEEEDEKEKKEREWRGGEGDEVEEQAPEPNTGVSVNHGRHRNKKPLNLKLFGRSAVVVSLLFLKPSGDGPPRFPPRLKPVLFGSLAPTVFRFEPKTRFAYGAETVDRVFSSIKYYDLFKDCLISFRKDVKFRLEPETRRRRGSVGF